MFETFHSRSSRITLSQHAVENPHSHSYVSATSARNAQFTTPGKGQRLLLGLIFSSMIALLARSRRSLTRSGAGGTIAVGTTIFSMGGWSWGLSLVYFFVSSTLFSHYREREKARTVADKFSKGSERDIGQVAANGGLATLLALAYGLTSSLPLRKLLQAGFIGAMATATADTWATELGVLSQQEPHLITTGKRVVPGTSGGITPLGAAASALGAFSLGAVFWGLQRFPKSFASLPLVALLSGLAGSFFDSLLGATLQAMYYCPVCEKETERRTHSCGTRTIPLRGIPWVDNDMVNFLATLYGALVALSLTGMSLTHRFCRFCKTILPLSCCKTMLPLSHLRPCPGCTTSRYPRYSTAASEKRMARINHVRPCGHVTRVLVSCSRTSRLSESIEM